MSKKSMLLSLVLLGCFVAPLGADEPLTRDMMEIHQSMKRIFPLAVKGEELSKKEQESLDSNLEALGSHVRHLGKLSSDKGDSFQVSYQMLLSHLDQIDAALGNNEREYALSLVREIPSMCTVCHTQDKRVQHFDSSQLKKVLKSDFQRGEYHFMTRDYQEALLDYNDYLAKQRKIKRARNNQDALEKILLIYMQVYRDQESALRYFERLLGSGRLSTSLALEVSDWVASLKGLRYSLGELDADGLEQEFDEVLAKGNEPPLYIDRENKVNALWLRALIYDFMEKNPTHEDAPKLLYWLASIENALDYGLSYLLPEGYLKHCVFKYYDHPYAQACFNQYKAIVELNYTGSAGTHLPLYQKLELEKLERRLDSSN